MHLVMRARPNEERPGGIDIALAVQPLEREFLDLLLKRRQLAQHARGRDGRFHELEFWYYGVHWLGCGDEHRPDNGELVDEILGMPDVVTGQPVNDRIEDGYPALVDGLDLIGVEDARTECDTMHIFTDGFSFGPSPKHTGYYIGTDIVRDRQWQAILEGISCRSA